MTTRTNSNAMLARRMWMVDRQIQQGLVRRMLVYLCATWLGIFALPICVRLIVTDLPFSQLATSLVADLWFPMMMSFLIFPILAWDSIRFSHRIAGPIYRISHSMRGFVNGEEVNPIELRENDFCAQLADDFNRVLASQRIDLPVPEVESQQVASY